MKLSPAVKHRIFVAVGTFAVAFVASWQGSHLSLTRDAILSAVAAGGSAVAHWFASWAQATVPPHAPLTK